MYAKNNDTSVGTGINITSLKMLHGGDVASASRSECNPSRRVVGDRKSIQLYMPKMEHTGEMWSPTHLGDDENKKRKKTE